MLNIITMVHFIDFLSRIRDSHDSEQIINNNNNNQNYGTNTFPADRINYDYAEVNFFSTFFLN